MTAGKVLVTGGAGFIGSSLALAPQAPGHDVTVLDNGTTGCWANLADYVAIRCLNAEVRDREPVSEAARGGKVVFHLAVSVGNLRSRQDPVQDAEVNVLGTLHVLDACRAEGVSRVVVSSSAAVFGELKTLPIDEEHPTQPDTPYGASKLCAETESLAYAKQFGMSIICLRYFNVYGQR